MRLTELHQERFEMKLYKQRYLCKGKLLFDTFWQVNKRLSLCGVVQSEKT